MTKSVFFLSHWLSRPNFYKRNDIWPRFNWRIRNAYIQKHAEKRMHTQNEGQKVDYYNISLLWSKWSKSLKKHCASSSFFESLSWFPCPQAVPLPLAFWSETLSLPSLTIAVPSFVNPSQSSPPSRLRGY